LAATAISSLACFLFFEGKRDWLTHTPGTISSYIGFPINLLSMLAAVQIAFQPGLLKPGRLPQPGMAQPAPREQPQFDGQLQRNTARPAPAQATPAAAVGEPTWQPFLAAPNSTDWRSVQQGELGLSRTNRVQWTGSEGGFRVTSLSPDFSFAIFRPLDGIAWSPDGEQLFVLGGDFVWQLSIDDWYARAWCLKPPPAAVFSSGGRLLVAQSDKIAWAEPRFVLLDPARFVPTEEIHFPNGSHIGKICGSRGSKRLFAVDAAGTIILGIDPDQRKISDRKVLQSISNIRPLQDPGDLAPRTLALSPDGKRLLYHYQRGLVIFSITEGRIVGEQAISIPGGYVRIALGANSSYVLCSTRFGFEVREIDDFSKITASFPAANASGSIDMDPTTAQILRMDNGEFHVFRPLDKAEAVLSRSFIEKAVKMVTLHPGGASALNRSAYVFAHPLGKRALVWGNRWALWIDWRDQKILP
jgi:hypothetical protein